MATASRRLKETNAPDPQAYLDRAIARYATDIAATARAALDRLRARFPGARLLVYDRRQSLVIGLAPAAGGAARFSVVLYPRWVRFFFLEGAAVDDPQGRLEGEGSQVRSIRVDGDAAVLDDRYIRSLVRQSLEANGLDLKTGDGAIVLKSTLTAPVAGSPESTVARKGRGKRERRA